MSTTKMTSKGQVVIPEEIRKRLGLKQGANFIVMGGGDAIVLKTIKEPSLEDFDSILQRTTQEAKEAGLTPKDIESSIKKCRKRKRT